MPGGTKVWPSVCIFTTGPVAARSAKSYAYLPLVMLGQDAGSTAITRVFLPCLRFCCTNGKAKPPKLEPPPAQPITKSGYSPAISICSSASCPITVWCRIT